VDNPNNYFTIFTLYYHASPNRNNALKEETETSKIYQNEGKATPDATKGPI
jgi:hypothetical protein